MACVDCLKSCNGIITPDRCISYTGDAYVLLGICGDESQFEINEIILNKLLTLMDGTSITITGLNTTCTLISNILSTQATTVPNLFQTLIKASCSLQNQITNLTAIVTAGYSFNTGCLSGITSTSSRDQITQALINKACDNATRITSIEGDYVKASELCDLVDACINPGGGGGGSTTTQYNTRMVPYAPIPYIGSLSNFDGTGKGLTAAGFEKVYLMNGLNGTQDWRGRSPIGAIQNVPGGVLDSAVDPYLPQNIGTNYVLNQKVGVSSVALLINQMPPHTHSISDPGHDHTINGYVGGGTARFAAAQGNYWYYNPKTSKSTTGISIGYSGSGLAHTNLQPSAACYYIVYLP